MVLRSSLDLELRPLLKALRNRIDGLRGTVMEPKDRLEVFSRDGVPFMQLEIRRDHMNVDLWLSEDKLREARATDLARPHPFDPEHAVVVRFERATDLTKVARWLEDAHAYAKVRKKTYSSGPAAPAEPKRAPSKSRPPVVVEAKPAKKAAAPKKKTARSSKAARSAKPPATVTKAKKTPVKKATAGAAKRPSAKRSTAARRA